METPLLIASVVLASINLVLLMLVFSTLKKLEEVKITLSEIQVAALREANLQREAVNQLKILITDEVKVTLSDIQVAALKDANSQLEAINQLKTAVTNEVKTASNTLLELINTSRNEAHSYYSANSAELKSGIELLQKGTLRELKSTLTELDKKIHDLTTRVLDNVISGIDSGNDDVVEKVGGAMEQLGKQLKAVIAKLDEPIAL